MKKSRGFWHALELLAGGAVMAEWAFELGNEIERVRHFLRPTPGVVTTFPCTNRFPCECSHRVEPAGNGQWVAVCDCADCAPIRLTAADVMVFEPDIGRLADAVAEVCGWERCATETAVRSAWRVGTWSNLSAPVIWCAGGDEDRLRRSVDDLVAFEAAPFVLLLPTRGHLSSRIDAALKREGCIAVPLADVLTVEAGGKFKLICPLDAARREFEERSATRRDSGKILRQIHEKIAQVGVEQKELRRAKERLEKMQGEGLFAFTKGVDARAFKIICTIFAEGDVAKASRELKMRDSTLRDEIKAWKGRGKAYETMLDLVEWRKSVGRHVEIPLNDAILLERSKSVDHPALLSDVLDGLLSMTEGNWEDKVEELAEVLRQHVPR
jgi:hypothetical protein